MFCLNKQNNRLTSIYVEKRVWISVAHMLNVNQQRHAAVKRKTYKQNSLSKTYEIIPLLCSAVVGLQIEYFALCFGL